MIIELISTGDELVSGSIADTNAAAIAAELFDLGLKISRVNVVGDDKDQLCDMFTEVSNRSDICIVTGGLGPTTDDLTSETAALAAGVDLEIHPEALENIQSFFTKRNMEMSEANKKQALFPSNADIIRNKRGTAPGFSMDINQCRFYFLPGVPIEMTAMLDQYVMPDIRNKWGIGENRQKNFSLFGVPESDVAQRLKDFNLVFPGLILGFRASFPIIEVKIIPGKDEPSSDLVEKAHEWALSRFDPARIVSKTGLSMEKEVARLLIEKKKTVAVAESCTGGLISNLLTDISGSSAYFLLGAVTYANEAKVSQLDVTLSTLEAHGAVHEKTAEEMAKGIMKKAGSDFGISTTGIAGPTGGTDEKPVGTICIGLAGNGFSSAKKYCLNYHNRGGNKRMFAHLCLNNLRKALL